MSQHQGLVKRLALQPKERQAMWCHNPISFGHGCPIMIAQVVVYTLLVPATMACLAYFIPTLIGLIPRRRKRNSFPTHSFAILIPARNEETTLPATLQSLSVLDYPPELVRVFVVADNCTDRTATVARWLGAVCLVRTDPVKIGKGHAVAFGLEWVNKELPDIVMILDADCRLNPTALRELDAAFVDGADVVQCAVRSENADDGPAGYVAAVGARVDEGQARGVDRLGLSIRLRGTGMAMRRMVLQRVPWTAFGLAEDVEYGRELRAAKIRVRHCANAVVACEAPTVIDELFRQRRRWRMAGILASKPLVLCHLIAATIVAALLGFFVWPAALIVLTGMIYLRAAWLVGPARRRTGAILQSPGIVLRLGLMTLTGLVRKDSMKWERTGRPKRFTHVLARQDSGQKA
jgi:cellulose synthase/poly-beta-1,6-N-acetylglucosamine synthase-like glycosyltransferase